MQSFEKQKDKRTREIYNCVVVSDQCLVALHCIVLLLYVIMGLYPIIWMELGLCLLSIEASTRSAWRYMFQALASDWATVPAASSAINLAPTTDLSYESTKVHYDSLGHPCEYLDTRQWLRGLAN